MKLRATFDGEELLPPFRRQAEGRLRWALGSFVSEVVGVRMDLHTVDRGVVCDVRIRLRSRKALRMSCEGYLLGETLDYVATRVGAAVSRHFQLNRILEG